MAISSSSANAHIQNNPPPPPPPLPSSSSKPSPSLSPNLSPQIPKIQDHPQGGVLYPVASSGRAGFIPKSFRPKSPPDQLVTVATNPGGFPPRSVPNQAQAQAQARPPYGFPLGDSRPQSLHTMRPPPPMLQHSQLGSRSMATSAGPAAPPVKTTSSISAPKAATLLPSSAPDFNGYRDPRDASRDDTVVTVKDRKVRLSDGDSLYALCRSWVRNGLPKVTQPQFTEGLKLLPKPLPATVTTTHVPDGDEDRVKEEDVGSVDHLSPRDLLQVHVKRAKRVRERLRKERLEKIGRYKERLCLLLPSPVEHFRDDTTGN